MGIIVVQEWTNTKQVTMDGCVFKRSVEKRTGGYSPADANDVELLALLNDVYFADSALNAEEVEVVAIEKQVVSGMNYKYTLKLNHLPNHPIQCEVVLYVQEWTNTKKVAHDGCIFKRSVAKRGGGWSPADSNDERLIAILDEVAGLSAENVDIITIESQMLPPLGMNYRYTLEMKGSSSNSPCTIKIMLYHGHGSGFVAENTCF